MPATDPFSLFLVMVYRVAGDDESLRTRFFARRSGAFPWSAGYPFQRLGRDGENEFWEGEIKGLPAPRKISAYFQCFICTAFTFHSQSRLYFSP